ncbi:unnamed protein product [Amoebophrya sp. A120]|nr:unnamed protein product [Amoebophrya sp. A120]|eukprot:GSA120T00001522001.1
MTMSFATEGPPTPSAYSGTPKRSSVAGLQISPTAAREERAKEPAGVGSPHGRVAREGSMFSLGPATPGAGGAVALSEGFSDEAMRGLKADGARAKGDGADISDLKACGVGCYLCYKEDNFGTIYMQWAENTPANAILWMQPKAPVPKFKFTQNAGRVQLADRVNGGLKFFETISRFVRELMVTYKANKITILSHVENKEVQVLFLKKSNKIFILKEASKSVLYEPDEIEAIGVVPYNNTEFAVMTMHRQLFCDKCAHSGAYMMK